MGIIRCPSEKIKNMWVKMLVFVSEIILIGFVYFLIENKRNEKKKKDRFVLILLTQSFKSSRGEVYLIQHYVIQFVSDLWLVGGFLLVLRFPPPIKLIAKI